MNSGDKYFVCGEKNYVLQISIYNTQTDNLINQFNLKRNGDYNLFDVLIQENNLYFYQSLLTTNNQDGGYIENDNGFCQYNFFYRFNFK